MLESIATTAYEIAEVCIKYEIQGCQNWSKMITIQLFSQQYIYTRKMVPITGRASSLLEFFLCLYVR